MLFYLVSSILIEIQPKNTLLTMPARITTETVNNKSCNKCTTVEQMNTDVYKTRSI